MRPQEIATRLWQDPQPDRLPVLPPEWTPLADFLHEWAARHADHVIRRSTFVHDFAVRSALIALAYTGCRGWLRSMLAKTDYADRQADGTFAPITINARGEYRMRRRALVRRAVTAVGRPSRERGAVDAEVYEDPHIRRRPGVMKTILIKATEMSRPRGTQAEVEEAVKRIEDINRGRQEADFADRDEVRRITGLKKAVVEKAMRLVRPDLKGTRGRKRTRGQKRP